MPCENKLQTTDELQIIFPDEYTLEYHLDTIKIGIRKDKRRHRMQIECYCLRVKYVTVNGSIIAVISLNYNTIFLYDCPTLSKQDICDKTVWRVFYLYFFRSSFAKICFHFRLAWFTRIHFVHHFYFFRKLFYHTYYTFLFYVI